MIRLENLKNLIDDEDYVEIVRENELGNQVWFGKNFRQDFDFAKRGKMIITSISMYTLAAGEESEGEDPVMLIYVKSSSGIKELTMNQLIELEKGD